MPLEIECKYCGVDFDTLRPTLAREGGSYVDTYFEHNTLFETDPPSLRKMHILLRLRVLFHKEKKNVVVTLKRPSEKMKTTKDVKVLDEREVEVADAAAFESFLEGLGYKAFAAYEKVREVWRIDGGEVVLDTLPFGPFVEIEGAPEAIERVALKLHLTSYPKSTVSYHVLHKQYAKRQGIQNPDRSFVFDAREREAWCTRLGIPVSL